MKILDVNDPDFAEKFADALGIQRGDTLEIVTPQFERTDGRKPVLSVDDWEGLRRQSVEMLKELGCCPWERRDDGTTLMLFPKEWYDLIPDGFVVTDINYNDEPFKHNETDDDIRFGMLAYGVLAEGAGND